MRVDSASFQINDPVYQNSDGRFGVYPTFHDVLIEHSIWLAQAFGIWGAEQDAEQKDGSASAEAGELNKRVHTSSHSRTPLDCSAL
ncbi:hypothetical protein Srot_1202 [Segniliparus rotundus DSM 44985]|uniref:Uncharacterized protein n=1 Tax=Segniliparus rotundus (strain ATCC BAA-972 / CDC 1076 / CIP 108378 / DSM 44985 / JCM 13578) TaxID=640132 RepID=D6ZFE9_SEGRD|nr:hypothetical protein Srot_1202 [Segniliparus rotundus DSM 44985]